LLLLVNLILSAILTGLIWTIQLVHYPMFNRVGKEQFSKYINDHQRRMSILVMPLMIAELAAAILLLFRSIEISRGLSFLLFALVLLIWLSTFFLSVPQHQKLLNGFDETAYRKLVSTNWIRTAAWTLRTALLAIAILGLA